MDLIEEANCISNEKDRIDLLPGRAESREGVCRQRPGCEELETTFRKCTDNGKKETMIINCSEMRNEGTL